MRHHSNFSLAQSVNRHSTCLNTEFACPGKVLKSRVPVTLVLVPGAAYIKNIRLWDLDQYVDR